MHVFMAPKTWYFSAASTRARSTLGFISMTEGCRKLVDSVLGWINRKSRSNISEGSSREITSSGVVKFSGGTSSPPLAAARYLLCILKRTSSDDSKVISASASQTDLADRVSMSLYRVVNTSRVYKLTTGTNISRKSRLCRT